MDQLNTILLCAVSLEEIGHVHLQQHQSQFQLVLLPPPAQASLRAQSLGTARIHIRSTTAGRLIANKLLELINPNVWL
jgi:hypothetical protein